jgi:phage shock protein A
MIRFSVRNTSFNIPYKPIGMGLSLVSSVVIANTMTKLFNISVHNPLSERAQKRLRVGISCITIPLSQFITYRYPLSSVGIFAFAVISHAIVKKYSHGPKNKPTGDIPKTDIPTIRKEKDSKGEIPEPEIPLIAEQEEPKGESDYNEPVDAYSRKRRRLTQESKSKSEMTFSRDTKSDLQNQIGVLKKQIEEKTKLVEEINILSSSTLGMAQEAYDKVESAEEKNKMLLAQIASLTNELSALRSKCENLTDLNSLYEQTTTAQDKAIALCKTQIEDLKTQIEDLEKPKRFLPRRPSALKIKTRNENIKNVPEEKKE